MLFNNIKDYIRRNYRTQRGTGKPFIQSTEKQAKILRVAKNQFKKNSNMKTNLFILLFLTGIFISCDKNDDKNPNDQQNNDIDTNSSVLFREGAGVTDVEGNTYKTVIINVTPPKSKSNSEQEWMMQNLRVTKYPDGSSIPIQFIAYCNGDSTTVNNLGYLYTWDALMNNSTVPGSQGACPNGWHVPTVEEYNTLITALGGAAVAGEKMKSTDTTYWNNVSLANNSSGFSALGGGYQMTGMYFFYKSLAKFWTSTENGSDGREVQIEGDETGMFNSYGFSKTNVKSSCRCIRD